MLSKNDFILSKNDGYEAVCDGIKIRITEQGFSNETIQYVEKILQKYLERKKEVAEYILDKAVANFYGDKYSREEMIEKLNEPIIEINRVGEGHVCWLNHDLDHEHIITLEFGNDLELSYVSIDG